MAGETSKPFYYQARIESKLKNHNVTRRDLLRNVGASVGCLALGGLPATTLAQAQHQVPTTRPPEETTPTPESVIANKYPHPPGVFINRPFTQIPTEVDRLLDDMEERGCAYFFEEAPAETGLVRNRAPAIVGHPTSQMSSIAGIGFGLSALCIAAQRHYLQPSVCEARIETTMAFLLDKCPHMHGFMYHFMDIESGERAGRAEISSIDTALLLCGVLLCRKFFEGNHRIQTLATKLYERVDWKWMLNGGDTLAMAWRPEGGFIKHRWQEKGFSPSRWKTYSELMTMYLMAIGAPRHPIPAKSWDAIQRPIIEFGGIEYISGHAPIFIHQYAHAWCDFRDVHDRYANYFINSIAATRAHQLFCLTLGRQFPWIDQDLWGISASQSRTGYRVWGGPPARGHIDGTIVPCATAGSLPFLPAECGHVLLNIRQKYGEKAWSRYGFVDAFQPQADWYAEDVLCIDVGASVLMAENVRTGFLWEYFMRNTEISHAMHMVGFQPDRSMVEVR